MTRGGGARALRVVSGAIYVVAWLWLVLGLLLAGDWIWASVLVVSLVGIWTIPAPPEWPRFGIRAATASVVAGLLWATQPLIVSFDAATAGSAWPWQAAALLVLPAIVEVRERERALAPWLGTIGWLIGWLPVFVAAALAAGIGGPLASGMAAVYVPVGILLFVAATVPFAIVAAWTHAISIVACGVLVVGAVAQTAFAAPSATLGPAAIVGPALFGIGWLLVGSTLLRRRPTPVDDAGEADRPSL
jgi:hypothetical protein